MELGLDVDICSETFLFVSVSPSTFFSYDGSSFSPESNTNCLETDNDVASLSRLLLYVSFTSVHVSGFQYIGGKENLVSACFTIAKAV